MFGIIVGLLIIICYLAFARKFVPEAVRAGATAVTMLVGLGITGASGWYGYMFYADPGYTYQVRTFTGDIVGYNTPGWHPKIFGSVYPWKKAMSVANARVQDEEFRSSSTLHPQAIRMLDRVDGVITQTTRFRLPEDITAFLNMAAEYRTPENLLTTELVPTVRQVITASSSLMSAEDYFNGKRNDFQMDFDYQMREGIFLVNRQEVTSRSSTGNKGSADASAEDGVQEDYGDQQQTRFVVTKQTNRDGTYRTRAHNYKRFGISVVDAKIADFEPNAAFQRRMEQQQQASADRSIAREQRIQEEEQKELVIVRGEREIAEEQARMLKDQIKRTTVAETDKALALIEANKQLEQAEIDKATVAIQLDRDKLVAQSKTVLADADKYEREARIAGDGALEQKLAAWVQGQTVWANASAKRAVPNTVTVLGGGSSNGVPTGANSEMQTLQQLMSLSLAKQLNVDTNISDVK